MKKAIIWKILFYISEAWSFNKGNNKITELQTIFQMESQNS
jgi:hypothetical protein